MSFEDVVGSEGGVPGEKPQTTGQYLTIGQYGIQTLS